MWVEVDGSEGEGGGQVLRGAIALSCVTGKPTRIFNIRAGRPNPGLQPQHMVGVQAACRVSSGAAEGLNQGSTEVRFTPGKIAAGRFDFDIKTAGSVALIMQALIPILAFANGESEVSLSGGTDVPWSPPIDYVKQVMLPLLGRFGVEARVDVLRRGYYPKGGGRCILRVGGAAALAPLRIVGREKIESVRGISHCANLPSHVARRQGEAAKKALMASGLENVRIVEEQALADGLGSGITLWADGGSGIRLGGDALGAREKRAEEVGREAAEKLVSGIRSGMAADAHLGDMAPLYMALAKGRSELGVSTLSRHAETMVLLSREFLGVRWEIERASTGSAVIRVDGAGMPSQGAATD